MATVLRNRFSYHRRLFLLLFAFSWALVACFVTFQYSREKRFKAERLDARLQLFNLRLLDALGEGTAPGAFLTGHPLPYGDLRVTVIDDDGRVLFDNSADRTGASCSTTRPTRCPQPTTSGAPKSPKRSPMAPVTPSTATRKAPTNTISIRP